MHVCRNSGRGVLPVTTELPGQVSERRNPAFLAGEHVCQRLTR
jgi:hypothetical protein